MPLYGAWSVVWAVVAALPLSPTPGTSTVFEVFAALSVAVGGIIGGALLALRKAIQPIQREVSSPSSVPVEERATLYERVREISNKLDGFSTNISNEMHDCEMRIIERIGLLERNDALIESSVQELKRVAAKLEEDRQKSDGRVQRLEQRNDDRDEGARRRR